MQKLQKKLFQVSGAICTISFPSNLGRIGVLVVHAEGKEIFHA